MAKTPKPGVPAVNVGLKYAKLTCINPLFQKKMSALIPRIPIKEGME
jgi:hypothetical protein